MPKTEAPLTSIIITNYNYAHFLPQAIESALSQTHSAVEVIMVDDGSTDNSIEVVQPYLEKITLIKQENQGVVAARNNGASKARGKFLVFLDADDYLPESFVAQSINNLQNNPDSSISYGNIKVFGLKEFTMTSPSWNHHQLLLTNYLGVTSMVKKSAFDQVGGFDSQFNTKKSYEDWDLWISLSAAGFVGSYDPEIFFYYRKDHQNNRNQANVWKKIQLRWPLITKHYRQYLKPKFLVKFPIILVASIVNKLKVLRS